MSKKNIPTQDFLNKTIFVISSPQEAVGLLLLSQGRLVENCILVKYIDYSDGKYAQIIKKLLDEVKIKNLYPINLYLHNVSMNKGSVFQTVKQIVLNKIVIRKFDLEKFQGSLFKNSYNFVTQINSPLLTLGKYDINKIYLMEHAPADSRNRIRRLKNIIIKNDGKTKYQKFISYMHGGAGKWYSIYKIIKIKTIDKIVNTLFPYTSALQYLDKGFSWIDYGDDFHLLDYRNLKLNFDFLMPEKKFNEEYKTLVMIEHKDAFKNIKHLHNEMKEIDFVEMYADILQKHISINEAIVCKFHPYILQNSNKLEIRNYSESMRARFLISGYRKVVFFDEIYDDELISLMPVEMFIKPLKINKIVGLYSSTMVIVQDWDEMSVISDCSWIKGFKHMRDGDKEIFSSKFTEA